MPCMASGLLACRRAGSSVCIANVLTMKKDNFPNLRNLWHVLLMAIQSFLCADWGVRLCKGVPSLVPVKFGSFAPVEDSKAALKALRRTNAISLRSMPGHGSSMKRGESRNIAWSRIHRRMSSDSRSRDGACFGGEEDMVDKLLQVGLFFFTMAFGSIKNYGKVGSYKDQVAAR